MRINKLHIAWFVVTFFLGITVFELVRLVEHKIDSRVSTATIEPNTTVRDFSDESSVYQTILADRFIEKRPVIILDSRFSRFSAEGQLEEFHKLESLTKTDGLEKATLEDFFNKNREALPGLSGDFTGYISLTR